VAAELTNQDIVEIQQLLALYGHAADSPSQDLFEKVFSRDAVFRSGATGLSYEGLAAIQAWFAQGKPPHPPAHQTTNVYAYVDGDTVRVKSKFLAINPRTGLPRVGDYNDVLVKTHDGWRIRERVSSDRFGAYDLEG
jgi:SnoaL-like domain